MEPFEPSRPNRFSTTRQDEVAITHAKRTRLDQASLAAPQLDAAGSSPRCGPRVAVLDVDNILCSLRFSFLLFEEVTGAASGLELRLNIDAVTKLARDDAYATSCELQAVYSTTNPAITEVFANCGWTVVFVATDAAVSRREVIKSLVHTAAVSSSKEEPTTVVLFSGDGELLSDEQLRASLTAGTLYLEVHSWLHALHNKYFELQHEFPSQVRLLALNDAGHDMIGLMKPTAVTPVTPVVVAPAPARRSFRTAVKPQRGTRSVVATPSSPLAKPPPAASLHVASSPSSVPQVRKERQVDPTMAVVASIGVAIALVAGWIYVVVVPIFFSL